MKSTMGIRAISAAIVAIVALAPGAMAQKTSVDVKAAIGSALDRVTASPDTNQTLKDAVKAKDAVKVRAILTANGVPDTVFVENRVAFTPACIRAAGPSLNTICLVKTRKSVPPPEPTLNVYYPGVGWVDIHDLWAMFWD